MLPDSDVVTRLGLRGTVFRTDQDDDVCATTDRIGFTLTARQVAKDTHGSTTDPGARLYRKSSGAEARLPYLGHLLMENRHGLIVDAQANC